MGGWKGRNIFIIIIIIVVSIINITFITIVINCWYPYQLYCSLVFSLCLFVACIRSSLVWLLYNSFVQLKFSSYRLCKIVFATSHRSDDRSRPAAHAAMPALLP